VEALVTTTLLNHRRLGWNVQVSASVNDNTVLSLGPDQTVNGTGDVRDSVGLPINGIFMRRYTYADANNDGIIVPGEINVDADVSYIGSSVPTRNLSITNGFDLFQGKLRLNAMFDYKGGYYIFNDTYGFQCTNEPFSCSGRSNPEASLEEQAAAVAAALTPVTSQYGYVEKGDFWRFRELSATIGLPQRAVSLLHARGASLSLGGRNLKVWSSYKGADPEENFATGDLQSSFATSAPRRVFTARLNLSF
jgi:TonB-dependent starch-binding outer membrane protein SusC